MYPPVCDSEIVSLPDKPLSPDQDPEAAHDSTFEVDHVRVNEVSAGLLATDDVNESDGSGGRVMTFPPPPPPPQPASARRSRKIGPLIG